jgi:hypothetical protein
MPLIFRKGVGEAIRDAGAGLRALCGCKPATSDEHGPLILMQVRGTHLHHNKGGTRNGIVNMHSIVKALLETFIPHGFRVKTKDMANMTMCDQVCLASSATVLIGQHGSGLSHAALLNGAPDGKPNGLVELGGGPAQVRSVTSSYYSIEVCP